MNVSGSPEEQVKLFFLVIHFSKFDLNCSLLCLCVLELLERKVLRG